VSLREHRLQALARQPEPLAELGYHLRGVHDEPLSEPMPPPLLPPPPACWWCADDDPHVPPGTSCPVRIGHPAELLLSPEIRARIA
jgi:hypothetical protein